MGVSWFGTSQELAHGQDATPRGDLAPGTLSKATRIERLLEGEARRLIERHIKPEEFQVLISVDVLPSETSGLPYVPVTIDVRPLEAMVPSELAPQIRKIDLEILLADRFKEPTRRMIESILTKKLALNASRGDRITFASLGFELESPEVAAHKEALTRVENEKRSVESQLLLIEQEKGAVERDLTTVRTALETLERSGQEKIAALIAAVGRRSMDQSRGASGAQSSPAAGPSREMDFIKANLPVFTGALLILLALLLVAITARWASATLAQAFGAIGEAVRDLGAKISDGLTSTRGPSPATAASRGRSSGDSSLPQGDGGASRGSSASLSLEMISQRILTIQEDLSRAFNQTTEGIVIAHVTQLLRDRAQVEKAVLALELWGKDRAHELFLQLDPRNQALIRDFLRRGSYSRLKIELLWYVAEDLKTKVLAGVFGHVRGVISEVVATRVLRLSAEDLALVAAGLPKEVLPRLFQYVDPGSMAAVLAILKAKGEPTYSKALKAVAQVPAVEQRTDLDGILAAALEKQINVTERDIQKAYFGWYQAITEAASEDLAEDFYGELVSSNPQLERFARGQIVTFGTFLTLRPEIQEEILLSLSNRDLAALLVRLDDQKKARILTFFDQRRGEIVMEEVSTLEAKGSRQVDVAHREAKDLIVAHIKALKGDGPLDEFLDLGRGQDHPSPLPEGIVGGPRVA